MLFDTEPALYFDASPRAPPSGPSTRAGRSLQIENPPIASPTGSGTPRAQSPSPALLHLVRPRFAPSTDIQSVT